MLVHVRLAGFGLLTTGGYLFFSPSYKRQMEEIEDDDNEEYRYKDTLVPLLKEKCVPLHVLFRRGYGAVLEIVRVLIGVVPNAHKYLEIWPPAFRTYNYIVPNFFNVPIFTLQIGRVYREATLANYVASRAAECSYCSAHACGYAIRRGNERKVVEDAWNVDSSTNLSDKDRAVIAVARGLGQVPCTLLRKDVDELLKYFKPVEAEWIACGAIGMGYLNKVTGKAGHNVENLDAGKPISEKDTFWQKLYHLRYIPGAVYWEQKSTWGHGITFNADTNCKKLNEIVGGYGFPVLKRVHHGRVIFSLTAMIRENMTNTGENNIPVETKVLLGICFTRVICDRPLEEAVMSMDFQGLPSTADKESARAFAEDNDAPNTDQPLLALVKAISPSPANVTEEIVRALKESNVSAEEIVEVVSLIGTLQLIHRLMAYYPPPYI